MITFVSLLVARRSDEGLKRIKGWRNKVRQPAEAAEVLRKRRGIQAMLNQLTCFNLV
jgi:hypothetical protein